MATLRSLNIRITANSSDLEKGLARATKNLTTFSEKATKLGASLSRSLTLPIVGAGGAALKMFADFEKLEKGLAAVMGSSELASKEMMLLKEAAKAPGLGFEEAVKGSVRLQAVGLSADQARRTLEAYGAAIAATGGSAENLDSVQYQLTQMISKNRILAQDFRIIQENVPLLGEALLKAFGTKNIEAIRDSGISATEFNDRIVETLRLMPQVQKATGGLGNTFDNLVDSLQYSAVEFGRMIADSIDLEAVMNNIAESVEGVVRYFKDMDSETRTAIVGWSLLAAAIGPIIFTIGKLTAAYAYLTKVRLALITVEKTANQLSIVSNIKILAVVAAVTALALAGTYVAKNWEAFSGRFQNLWTELVWSASNGIRKLKKILNDWQESLGINIWKFKDTEQLKAPDLIDVPSFQSAGEFIKSLGRDLAGLVGIQSKAASSVADSIGLPSTDTGGAGGGGASGGGGGGSKGWGGAAQENIAKIAAGYQGVALSIKSATVAHAEMTMKMVEGTTTALTAMQSMTLGLADSFSQLAESGSASMSELSKAVVSEIRKMIVAKIRLGVASAIGEKMAAGPFGIFLAAGAGLAASAIFSRILGSLKIPALAQGGAAFGPTLAMVGDNPNAMRDPELIMPFSKMKKMILDDIMPGAGRVQEVRIASSAIEIDGRKLRILLEQENNYARGLR